MGPHSFKCGSPLNSGVKRSGTSGFNGAALFQVRKSVDAPPFAHSQLCFNGAALFQVRKSGLRSPSTVEATVLQWGRTLSSAEVNGAALFEVWEFACFNGAALFQVRKWQTANSANSANSALQWGRTLSSAEVSSDLVKREFLASASMGPHSFKCGSYELLDKVQRLLSVASMGPHSFKCGSSPADK